MSATKSSRLGPAARLTLLVTMAFAGTLSFFDGAAIILGLPAITEDLGTSHTGGQWLVTAYLLALPAAVLTAGRLSDTFGAVRVAAASVCLFALASVGVAMTDSIEVAIGARGVQGLAAGAIMATSIAAISTAFPEGQVGRGIALVSGFGVIGLASAPIVAGLVITLLDWRWLFWLNVPFAVLIAVPALIASRGLELPRRPLALDPAGAVLLLLALVALNATLLGLGDGHPPWLSALGAVVAIGLAVGFVAVEVRGRRPMLEVALLRRRRIVAPAVVLFIAESMAFTFGIYVSLFLQQVQGLSALETGLLMLSGSAATFAVTLRSDAIADRLGPLRVGVLAGSTVALGVAGIAVAVLAEQTWPLVPLLALIGFGLPLSFVPPQIWALAGTEPARRGEVSGVLRTVQQLGGSLGVAAASSIFVGVSTRFETGSVDATVAGCAAALGFCALLAFGVALASLVLFRARSAGTVQPT